MLSYSKGTLTIIEARKLLSEFDTMFSPALSSHIDISIFAEKLAKHACFILCKNDDIVAGYIAFYENKETKMDFISSICVRESFRSKGIATQMIEYLITQSPSDINYISLEVRKNNKSAVLFYDKLDFITKEDRGEKLLMIKQIK